MAGGRPTEYSIDKAHEICDLLVTFDEDGKPHSIRKICEIIDIGMTTFFRWLTEHEQFRELYRVARAAQADIYADLRIEVAWENPQIEIPTKAGSYTATDSAGIARNRLRFDAASKHAGQLNPQKYGDKVQAEVTGKDGGPLQIVSTIPRPQKSGE